MSFNPFRFILSLFFLLNIAVVFTANAQTGNSWNPSQMIPFQGRLFDEAGAPLNDGVYQLTFRIYGSETSGSAEWDETHQHVSVINGYVNVVLGGIKSIFVSGDNAVTFDATSPKYLGITIGRYQQNNPNRIDLSSELFPRHQLVPSFHAVRSSDSARLGGELPEYYAPQEEVDQLNALFSDGNRTVPDGEGEGSQVIAVKESNYAKDADTLDGIDSSAFLQDADLGGLKTYFTKSGEKVSLASAVTVANATHATTAGSSNSAKNATYLGAGTTYTPSYFRNASNLNKGMVSAALLPTATSSLVGLSKIASHSGPDSSGISYWVDNSSGLVMITGRQVKAGKYNMPVSITDILTRISDCVGGRFLSSMTELFIRDESKGQVYCSFLVVAIK